MNTQRPLEEKMALFWRHVFATGNFNGEDIIDIVVQQPACGRFVARSPVQLFRGRRTAGANYGREIARQPTCMGQDLLNPPSVEGWLGRALRDIDPNKENVVTGVSFGPRMYRFQDGPQAARCGAGTHRRLGHAHFL